MTLKHIARYRAMVTGNTIEEEMAILKLREKGSYEKLFEVKDEFNAYRKYEWQKKNKRLREEK